MKAAILIKPGKFRIEERPVPVPGHGEILVKVQACGICSSEVPMYRGTADVSYPRFLGHEVSGTVTEIGSGVDAVRPGDRVCLYSEGEGYAEYTKVPASWAIPIPDGISFAHALGEPIACSVNGVRKLDPQLGDSVALVGVGFMGLILLQVLKARGAWPIIAVDRRDSMLQLALELGADHVINAETESPSKKVAELTSGRGVDIGIEAVGSQGGLDCVTELVRMEGKLEVFGFHQGPPRQVKWGYWNWMAFQIVNAHSRKPETYVEGIRIGIQMLASGALNMKPLVTHVYSLEEIGDAFRLASDKGNGFVKGYISPNA